MSAAVLHDLARLLAGPEAGRQDHDQVLQPLRQLGHPALAVGQLSWCLVMTSLISSRLRWRVRGGELGVRGQGGGQ